MRSHESPFVALVLNLVLVIYSLVFHTSYGRPDLGSRHRNDGVLLSRMSRPSRRRADALLGDSSSSNGLHPGVFIGVDRFTFVLVAITICSMVVMIVALVLLLFTYARS
jgi:hypothetical protein